MIHTRTHNFYMATCYEAITQFVDESMSFIIYLWRPNLLIFSPNSILFYFANIWLIYILLKQNYRLFGTKILGRVFFYYFKNLFLTRRKKFAKLIQDLESILACTHNSNQHNKCFFKEFYWLRNLFCFI